MGFVVTGHATRARCRDALAWSCRTGRFGEGHVLIDRTSYLFTGSLRDNLSMAWYAPLSDADLISALDPTQSAKLETLIDQVMTGRTDISITHRLISR